MFDWDRFKKGKIVVTFDDKEAKENFLEKCEENNLKWMNGDKATDMPNFVKKPQEMYIRVCREGDIGYGSIYGIKEEWEVIKWEVKEMKELTFKEVIVNIKEGEVWDDGFLKIEMISGSIRIGNINGEPYKELIALVINECRKFKLQRKEYTFEEVFKAYEEGKEIEDYRGAKYKKIDGVDHYKMEFEQDFNARASKDDYWFSFEEIRGKWYIND